MPSFLFVAEMPPIGYPVPGGDAAVRWCDFAEATSAIEIPTGSTPLAAKNVWLFPCEANDKVLTALVNTAHAHRLTYSAFLISDKGEVLPLTK